MIGCILCLGALLMMVGNAVINGAKQGLERSLAERMSGHLTLVAGDDDTQNIFFSETIQPLKLLPEYSKIKELLETQEMIDGFLPMSRGYAIILNESGRTRMDEEASDTASLLFGMDFDEYQQVFEHNVITVEGELLQHGERGVLITEKDRQEIYDLHNIWVVPQGCPLVENSLPPEIRASPKAVTIKDELVFLGLSSDSLESDIRVPVKGIVRFQNLNKVWMGSFIDIESFRQCFGYLTAENTDVDLSEDKVALLESDGEDDIFAADDMFDEVDDGYHQYDVAAMQQQTQQTEHAFDTEKGAYQFVAVKLKPGVPLQTAKEQLERLFSETKLPVKVLTWKQSTGSVAQLAALTQGVLQVFVWFIFFVAAIVITNTLSMAALERTAEIGMMRAIGSRKGFIGKMLLAEIFVLSILFGGLGMALGAGAAWEIGALQLPADSNNMLSVMAGGDVLRPIIDIMGFVYGSGQLAVVTILAALYPMAVAAKITPLEAIARD